MSNFYQYLRRILFALNPEVAHRVTLNLLRYTPSFYFPKLSSRPVNVMGIQFPNPIGLAAGLDKNGVYIEALAKLGFGFIEIGTITPKAQEGNPKPRLFRLMDDEALINRLGFNNQGLAFCLKQLEKTQYKGILGINIGKNKITPNEKAHEDYLMGLRGVYPYASYVTINISSPNTENLRALQKEDSLERFLSFLKNEQLNLKNSHQRYVPLVVKIAPDLTQNEIQTMAKTFIDCQIDGVIATNTTVSRAGIKNHLHVNELGGLSGKPLFKLATHVLSKMNEYLDGKIPIIASGGIMNLDDAKEKKAHGASLIQIYTGLIYKGPRLVKELVEGFY